MKRFFCLTTCLALISCVPSGVSVYDDNDNRVGKVVIDGSQADVYDKNDNRLGEVRNEGNIYDTDDNRLGMVRASGDIVDRNGNRKGKIKGKDCFNRDDDDVGHLAEDIEDRAAGGACFLLFFR